IRPQPADDAGRTAARGGGGQSDHSPLTMRAAQRPEEEVPTAAHQSHQPREPRAKLQVPFSEAPSGLDAAEELQRRGGDGLWPLEEPEMTGVRAVEGAAVGEGVSKLAAQVRPLPL